MPPIMPARRHPVATVRTQRHEIPCPALLGAITFAALAAGLPASASDLREAAMGLVLRVVCES